MESNNESSPAENGVAAPVTSGDESAAIQNNSDDVASPGSDSLLRQGTISSARFNILCTMVGGGCLSLPMAFQKTGNGLFGPILLVITAFITEFCFRLIVAAIRRLSPVQEGTTVIGNDSFETMAGAAFGSKGFIFAKWLVTAVSFDVWTKGSTSLYCMDFISHPVCTSVVSVL